MIERYRDLERQYADELACIRRELVAYDDPRHRFRIETLDEAAWRAQHAVIWRRLQRVRAHIRRAIWLAG